MVEGKKTSWFFVYKFCLYGHCRQLNIGDVLRGSLFADGFQKWCLLAEEQDRSAGDVSALHGLFCFQQGTYLYLSFVS